MSGRNYWRESPYSAKAKKESLEEMQAVFKAERREREHRATYCQCANPVPNMGSCLGWKTCRLCQRLIYKEG